MQEDGTSNEVNRARIRSLSDVLLAASNMSGPSRQREEEEEEGGGEGEEEENEYFSDYDNEMELDFDASVSGEDTGENEIDSRVVRGSLSVLLHRGGNSGMDESVANVSSSDDSLSQVFHIHCPLLSFDFSWASDLHMVNETKSLVLASCLNYNGGKMTQFKGKVLFFFF